jgi:hypothetical protein
MVHFEFGQDRLTQPHPLNAFELAQGAVKVPLEVRFVAEQVVELRGERNVLLERFELALINSFRSASAPSRLLWTDVPDQLFCACSLTLFRL